MIPFSIIILIIVFILIIFRRIGNFYLSIWQIMSFGALLSLATFQISLKEAIYAVNYEVILFLIGMFVIGEALYESGYINKISYRIFNKAKNVNQLFLLFIFTMGFLSAILMNDTIAIIGTGIALYLSKQYKISYKLLLIALCFSITIGSVISPIGNPQNLIIATNKNFHQPFYYFLKYLFIPTIVNFLILFLLLKFFFKNEFKNFNLDHIEPKIEKNSLIFLSQISLTLVIFLIFLKIVIILFHIPYDFDLVYIAVIGALPILLFSKKRWQILKKIDWYTIVFFISMFILMQAVWNSNFFQNYIHFFDFHNLVNLSIISILLSQIISNVPLVYLFLTFLEKPTIQELITLAWSSTIAGNLTILGAASNVIIIQNAEKYKKTITFLEFLKIGFFLTLFNFIIYAIFIYLLQD